MSELTYDELIRELFPRLTGGIRWGLERTRQLLESAGNPHRSFRSIHVGGTNGKGSVAATLASMLAADGRRTGLYSSPHLCTFRERIQIDGNAITEDALVASATKLWPHIEQLSPSFFEATTVIGLQALADAGVEVGVIEVGLGGRLDSTNVIEPDLAIITNIALDHAEYLGNTIESVAYEKAGIIKAGVPVLTAERGTAANQVFAERAGLVGAELLHLPEDEPVNVKIDFSGTNFELPSMKLELMTPLIGRHQAVNCALAAHATRLLPPEIMPALGAVEQGARSVRWPGRMQVESIGESTWIFDVAHNVAGVNALVESINALNVARPLVVLVGILGDKDWHAMLPPLFEIADAAVITRPPTAPSNRAWQPNDVIAAVPFVGARVVADFTRALERAAILAESGTVLITGSFHTVGDALIALGRAPFGSDVTLPQLSFSR